MIPPMPLNTYAGGDHRIFVSVAASPDTFIQRVE